MQSRGVEDRVQVRTFHSWCYWMLRTYGIPTPSEREYPDYEKRLAASVSEVVKAVDEGHIPTEQYDAVLTRIMHDSALFCRSMQRPRTIDRSHWIGMR
jgi:hypothetical protein